MAGVPTKKVAKVTKQARKRKANERARKRVPVVIPERLADAPPEILAAYKALNGKQRVFALELPTAKSKADAARVAGYTAATANAKAHDMAKEPHVAAIVDWCMQKVIGSSLLTIERLKQELECIAYSDPRKLRSEKGGLLDLEDMDEGTARAISGFEVSDKGIKVNLWNKLAAIDTALKLLSAFPEKKQQAPSAMIVGVVVVPEKGQYRHPQREAIEGTLGSPQRVDGARPAGKTFRVTKD